MDPAILGVIAVLALCVIGPFLVSDDQRHNENRPAQAAFQRIYGTILPAPRFEVGSSYGYPTFTITFSSKTEMEKAASLHVEFKREINRLYRGYGSFDRPFDANLAIFITYSGHIEEMVADWKQRKAPLVKGQDVPPVSDRV